MSYLSGGHVALLLIDINNSFFDPKGLFYYPAAAEVLGPVRRLLESARSAGCLVIHALEAHRAGFEDFEALKLPKHCLEGSFDAAPFPGFEPQPGELVIRKRRFSAFFGTDLALVLSEQKVGRLLIGGVKTNVCIRATVQDAFAYGFQPAVVREAVNSNRPHLHEAALEDIDRYFGDVLDVDQALALIKLDATTRDAC